MKRRKRDRYLEEIDRLGRALENKEGQTGNPSMEGQEEAAVCLLPYEPDPKEAVETLYDLYTGIIVFSVLFFVAGVWWVGSPPAYGAGVLLGGAAACGLGLHMYRSLDVALELPPREAVRYTRKRSGVRMLWMGVLLGCACAFPAHLHILGVVLGLLSLKLSAYCQPLIHIIAANFRSCKKAA